MPPTAPLAAFSSCPPPLFTKQHTQLLQYIHLLPVWLTQRRLSLYFTVTLPAQVYDVAPLQLGPLTTSLLVPPLLLAFYVVLGLLACISDNLTATSSATQAARWRMDPRATGSSAAAYLAACFGVLALNLYVSASFFAAETSPAEILWVLGALAAVNWTCFDGTNQGVALGLLCALGAPAAELLLMSLTGCWHYSRPDLAGVFVSWVPLCYLFYVPAVSNLARYLWHTCRPPAQQQ